MSFLAALMRAQKGVRNASKGIRRKSRWAMGSVLARLIGQRTIAAGPITGDISRVLVCRINGRMGNTLFLTPLVNQIHDLFPHAAIDLALSYPRASELFGNHPGLRQVIGFPHRDAGMVWKYFAAVRKLRSQTYDVAIDPAPESTGGRIVLTLARARYRIGFAGGTQWAPLTHPVPEPAELMHQAIEPLFLLSGVFAAPYDERNVRLSLHLTAAEVAAGRSAMTSAARRKSPGASANGVFGFFAHATGYKTVERAWWLAFWKAFLELEPGAIPVEFLPSPTTALTDSRFASVHFLSIRDLTAAIAATRVFISADTGPMHLASTTAVPTVGLFGASNPTLFRPLKPTDLVIDVRDCPPWLAARRCQGVWLDSLSEIRAKA